MKNLSFTTLLIILTSYASYAQDSLKFNKISSEIERVMEEQNVPAISVGIIINGEKTFINKGHFSRKNKSDIDEQSIFQIASIGKMFIGIITHNLILEGKIRIDQSIVDFLPESYSKKTLDNLKSITFLQLLQHRSGLSRNPKAGEKRKDGSAYLYNFTEADFETALKREKIQKNQNSFGYSNFGYALLAYLLEEATDKTYNELLKEYVTDPYQLQNTAVQLSSNKKSSLVTPYRKDNRLIATVPWEMGKIAPVSAMYSNVSDLTNLMEFHIKAYREYQESKKISSLILSYNTKEAWQNTGIQYGYGLFAWSAFEFGHGGDMDGFGSEYSFTPEKDYGVVFLTSSGGKWTIALTKKINAILSEDN